MVRTMRFACLTGLAITAIAAALPSAAFAGTETIRIDPRDWSTVPFTSALPDTLASTDGSPGVIEVAREGYGSLAITTTELRTTDWAGETVDSWGLNAAAMAERTATERDTTRVRYANAWGAGWHEEFEQRYSGLKRDTVLSSPLPLADRAEAVQIDSQVRLPGADWSVTVDAEIVAMHEQGAPRPGGAVGTSPMTTGGDVTILAPDGTPVYVLRAVWAVDATGTEIDGQYILRRDPSDATILHVTQQIAAAPLRSAVYPVRIDPTVTIAGTASGQNIFPYYLAQAGFTNYVYQNMVPAPLLVAGEITEFGYRFDSGVTGLVLQRVQIQMGESNLTNPGATISGNANVVSLQTVYDSGMTVTSTAGGYDVKTLSTPFSYSGNNNLVIVVRIDVYTAAGSGQGTCQSIIPAMGAWDGYDVNTGFNGDSFTNYSTALTGGQFEIITIDITSPTPGALPDGYVGEAYSETFTATGGTGALTWSATGSPDGLTMSTVGNDGDFAGTPTSAALGSHSNIEVTATDGAGSVMETYTMEIFDLPLVTEMVDDAVTDIAFSSTVAATGGKAPLAWSATGLPSGLTIDPSTGEISGTATASGTSSVTIIVTDHNGRTDDWTLDFIVQPPINITETALPGATETGTYSHMVAREGGSDGVTWSASGLPAGLSIDLNTGEINGTVAVDTAENSPFMVTVTATDTNAAASTAMLELEVNVVPTIPIAFTPNPIWYVAFELQVPVDGGTAPFTYSATGMVDGLMIDSATGIVSGTVEPPTEAIPYEVTLQVTDANGVVGTQMVQFIVLQEAPSSDCAYDPAGRDLTIVWILLLALGSLGAIRRGRTM